MGAVARLVRNFGLYGLRLVAPGDWRTVECWRTAWGAQDVLEAAEAFDALPPAIAGACYVAALSGRRPREAPPLDVQEAAAEIAALPAGEEAALVFGPETSGLTDEEMATCGRRVSIPTDPAQPSLNLSHAVAIAAHEVHRARARPGPPPPEWATHADKEEMLAILRRGLEAVEALPRRDPDAAFLTWRGLAMRTPLTRREVQVLRHLGHKLARRG